MHVIGLLCMSYSIMFGQYCYGDAIKEKQRSLFVNTRALDAYYALLTNYNLGVIFGLFDSSISINKYYCVLSMVRLCYLKRSSSPYPNVIPDLINGAY